MTERESVKREELTRAHTSPVWSYFKVCEDNAVLADCLLCGVRMSRGGTAPNRCGTTNLRRHVLYTHNIHLPSAKGRNMMDEVPKKALRKKAAKKKSPLVKKTSTRKTNLQVKKGSLSTKMKKSVEQIKEEHDSSLPQPEPVMCIKWNTYLSNMTSALPLLLHDEQFVDVTLACEGQSLKCHKILLAACSPYFYELLSAAGCRHPIIMFKDYHFWELQALVSFMYCGEVNVPQSQLPRILRVAEALQIKGLAKPASQAEPPVVNEDQLLREDYDKEHSHVKPQLTDNKRKRRPSTHNCCKNPPVTAKKPKNKPVPVKPRGKIKPAKKKVAKSPSKKIKLSPPKKYNSKKAATLKGKLTGISEPMPSLVEQNCPLPELLPSDMPDMLSDILAMKDAAGITDGISLPVAHGVGSVDGIFPLEDLEGMKMEMDEDGPEIGRFLANGLHHDEQFDLLPHISPECKLGEDVGEGR